ncbi:hypothetical protein Y032_0003g1678 [Ancylostoma ceylanicum]|uniref:Uncharacterized protein n=1 Tax=Ancylostoma ceylanicum TaxID=53326 RepID=A0A016VYE7_9BILA|nr:hypothetical protein Y032_0003g1678 [Ancylostoma ceylanicum]
MSSPSVSEFQRKTRSMTAVESEGSDRGTPDDVSKALQQLRADKKTPVFSKTIANNMAAVQDRLSSVLAENQELHQQVNSLRDENISLKRALADAEAKQSSHVSAHELNSSKVDSAVDEKERLTSIVIHGISESISSKSTVKANYDYAVINDLLDHLDNECVPQGVYRLGGKSISYEICLYAWSCSSLLLISGVRLLISTASTIFRFNGFSKKTVFILFYMSGSAAGHVLEPPDCGKYNNWTYNYTQTSRIVFAEEYEKIVHHWVQYVCSLEKLARENFTASESELKNNVTFNKKTTCQGFAHEKNKGDGNEKMKGAVKNETKEEAGTEKYKGNPLNIFTLAREAFKKWNETSTNTLEDATLYGCHYNRNETTGRVVCLFCKGTSGER